MKTLHDLITNCGDIKLFFAQHSEALKTLCRSISAPNGYYQFLDVTRGMKSDDIEAKIKRNYRDFLIKWHSDKIAPSGLSLENQKIAEELFKLVKEAHEVLTDDQRKYIYDERNPVAMTQESTNTQEPYPKRPKPTSRAASSFSHSATTDLKPKHKKYLEMADVMQGWIFRQEHKENLRPPGLLTRFNQALALLEQNAGLDYGAPLTADHFAQMYGVAQQFIKDEPWFGHPFVRDSFTVLLNAYALQQFPKEYDAFVEPLIAPINPGRTRNVKDGYFFYMDNHAQGNMHAPIGYAYTGSNGTTHILTLEQLLNEFNRLNIIKWNADQLFQSPGKYGSILHDALAVYKRMPAVWSKIVRLYSPYLARFDYTSLGTINRTVVDLLLDHESLCTAELFQTLSKSDSFRRALSIPAADGRKPYQRALYSKVFTPQLLSNLLPSFETIVEDYLSSRPSVTTAKLLAACEVKFEAVDNFIDWLARPSPALAKLTKDNLTDNHLVALLLAGVVLRIGHSTPFGFITKLKTALSLLTSEQREAIRERHTYSLCVSSLLPEWYQHNRTQFSAEKKREIINQFVINGQAELLATLLAGEPDLELDLPGLWASLIYETTMTPLARFNEAAFICLAADARYAPPDNTVLDRLKAKLWNEKLVEALTTLRPMPEVPVPVSVTQPVSITRAGFFNASEGQVVHNNKLIDAYLAFVQQHKSPVSDLNIDVLHQKPLTSDSLKNADATTLACAFMIGNVSLCRDLLAQHIPVNAACFKGALLTQRAEVIALVMKFYQPVFLSVVTQTLPHCNDAINQQVRSALDNHAHLDAFIMTEETNAPAVSAMR